MSIRRVVICLSMVFLVVVLIGIPFRSQLSSAGTGQTPTIISGRNVNMVSGTTLPGGDPWLQRQNEPSIAVSSRNPLHLLAGANDYRTVDMPTSEGELPGKGPVSMVGDAWLGVFTSYDGGESWTSTMLPGFPQDSNPTNPLKNYHAAADPVVRCGPNGLFYYSGIAFNRDTNLGVVFVARFIDNNNIEGGGLKDRGNSIQYIDTKIIAIGNAKQFLDKPWIAVDQPRAPMSNITVAGQSIPRHNVYIAYSAFATSGSTTGDIMFARSADCGTTWGAPIKISSGTYAHQGAVIAIKPVLGEVLVAWRRFAQTKVTPDSIYVAQSITRGVSFASPVKVADIAPFDQPTTSPTQSLPPGTLPGPAFRTNSYPTMAVDASGHVYLAWSQRGVGPSGDARIMVSTSYLGSSWSSPQPAASMNENASFLGHQIMPSFSFAGGKLILVWYDERHDVSAIQYGFNKWIQDAMSQSTVTLRHTMDVWAAVADTSTFPTLTWKSTQVSRYLYAALKDDHGDLVKDANNNPIVFPAQFNCVNYPLFKGGASPFDGDYIDVAASPTFRIDTWRNWYINTTSSDSPVFQVAWTDNRDVRPPLNGDWTAYTPASSEQSGAFITTPGHPTCSGGNAPGMRNQNIYNARVTWGIEAGSPTNTKPLNLTGAARAFVVYVKNNTGSLRHYKLTIAAQPVGGQASFLQFGLLTSLNVDIAEYSTISRPVFISSTDPTALVTVNIAETDASGSTITGGLKSSVLINGDPTNPQVPAGDETHNPNIINSANPNIINWYVNPNIINPNIINPNIINPNIINPNIINPNIINYGVSNPNIINPNIINPNIINPNIINVPNPNIINPNIINPNIINPNIINATPEDNSITDVQWTVTNTGTATTAYTLKTLSKMAPPEGVYVQLLVYKVHYTPAVAGAELSSSGISGCELKQEPHDELVLSVINPNIINPNIINPNIINPNIINSSVENATFSVAPGEEVTVDLRVLDTATSGLDEFIHSLGFAVTSQAVNSAQARQGIQIPPVAATSLVIGTGSLPDGVVGIPYQGALTAYGGSGNYSWSLSSGQLPTGLYLGNGGAIVGTPTVTGAFSFNARVEDGSQFDTQQYYIVINSVSGPSTLTIVTTALPSGVQGNWYGATLVATGGVWPRTWSLTSGALPDGLILDSGGVISGTPTVSNSFSFAVRVTDKNGAAFTQPLSITIAAHSTVYNTISGYVYSETGQPLAGAVLRGLPDTPVSDATGFYTDNVPTGWSGTVTPFLGNHTFNPTNRTYSGVSGPKTNQDYNYQSASFSISGTVLFGGTGLAGVVMNGLPGNPATNSNGAYNITVGYGTTWTVTPTLAGYTFTPPSQTYTYISSSHTTNYTATSIFGPASKLVFTQSPSGGVGGTIWAKQPVVEIQDATGKKITTDSSTLITLAINNNPGKGTLGGPGATSITVINGEAAFAGLSINKGGWGYTLQVTSTPGGFSATSETFSIEGFSDVSNTMHALRQWLTATPIVISGDGETDEVLITGGNNNYISLSSVEFYDPLNNDFVVQEGLEMYQARYLHTATSLLNGNVLIVGGYPSSTTAEIFDPSAGTFTPTGGTQYPRIGHRATLLQNGKVLITGNRDSDQDTAEIYDPKNGVFTETNPMNSPRCMHTSTLLRDGRVLITGGSYLVNETQTALSSAELYDPDSGEFTEIEEVMAGGARFNHQATLLDNGRVLITGGNNGVSQVTSAEIYWPPDNDYPTGHFSLIGNLMLYAHEGNQATLLRDGTVLLIGGNSSSAANEIFDPIASTFRATGPMSRDRSYGATAVLLNGRVLIAGGYSTIAATNTAEVWNALTPFPTHVISGTITYSWDGEAGVGGVILVGLPGHPMTNEGGYYEGLVMDGWSGTVTPTKPGYTFDPLYRSYSKVGGDFSGEDYSVSSAPAFQLAFRQQPGNTVVGTSITPVVTVEIWDEFGNILGNASNPVTLSLSNPSGATLSGTLTVNALEGVATFSDLKIDKLGSGYILRATSGTLTEADSNPFNIIGAGASAIQVETAPDGSGAIVPAQNVSSGSSITVYAISRGAGGNFIANVAADSWSLVNLTGGVVNGDLVVAGDGKSAVFTGHLIGSAQIHAAKSPLTSIDSGALTVTGGAAGKIALTGPPSADAGFMSQAFTLTSQEGSGNPVNVTQDTVFSLASNTMGIGTFYSDPVGKTPITQVTILLGQSSTQFYYLDNTGGTRRVTATWVSGGTNLGSAIDQITIKAEAGKIVFSSDRDGNDEIYIMNVDGTGQTRLTTNAADDYSPCLSSDGSRIAFMSKRDGNDEIYIMNADGSGQTRLTNNTAYDNAPSLSPDGSKIAFFSDRDGGNYEIYIMNVDGSGQTRLTTDPAIDEYPRFSADGTKIAFDSTRDGNDEIYIMNADGSGQTRLTNNTATDEGPCFSPDGTKIVFQSNRTGDWEIYVMNTDGSVQTNLTNNPAVDAAPSFSPDGSKIAFHSGRDGNYEIYVMNADGSGQTRLTNNTAWDSVPSWGGSKLEFIAFTSNRGGGWEIYVMNADGSGQTNLTNNPAYDETYPHWSPSGSKIAFTSFRDGNNEIYVMNADGSGQTRVTNNPANDEFPSWSPDGSKIVFISLRDGNSEVYVMNADGSGQTRLTNNAGDDLEPSWSPDGSKIVFSSHRDGNWEIYVMNADGSGQTDLTNNPALDGVPSWSSDGTKIAFMSYRDGNDEIYVMNADGSGQTRVTNNPALDDWPSWSPDGSRIALVSDRDGNWEVYVMNADGTNVRRLTNNSSNENYPTWRPHPKIPEVYQFVTKWGSYGTGDGQFDFPCFLAVDSSGNVYVTDQNNHRIQKFTSDGTFVSKWGSQGEGDGQFNYPVGIAVDSSGHVYVADNANYRIQKFTSDGTFVTKWGSQGTGDGQFNYPFGIVIDSSGDVYVVDAYNQRIQKFTSDGIFVTKWGSLGTGDGQFDRPFGIAVDSSGQVYVADYNNHRIQKFTSNGTFMAKWGSQGTGDGQFSYPAGIAVDSSGYVYAADTRNYRIQKFTSDGTFMAKWGSQGNGDGQFDRGGGIAVDSSGYVYVTDAPNNNRIQKFRKK